jgi:hypothetical protein
MMLFVVLNNSGRSSVKIMFITYNTINREFDPRLFTAEIRFVF